MCGLGRCERGAQTASDALCQSSRSRRKPLESVNPFRGGPQYQRFYKKTLIRFCALESNHAINSLLFQKLWHGKIMQQAVDAALFFFAHYASKAFIIFFSMSLSYLGRLNIILMFGCCRNELLTNTVSCCASRNPLLYNTVVLI